MKKTFDLSYGQKALYLIQQLNPKSTSYNVGLSFKFYSKFNETWFHEAIIHVMKKQSMLCAKFVNEDGKVSQYISDSATYDFYMIHVTGCEDSTIIERVNNDFHTCYQLLSDNMLRIYLYRRESYDLVSFVLHHIITDYHSLAILMQEFMKTYYSLEHGLDLQNEENNSSYDLFVKNEMAFLGSNKYEKSLKFWKSRLSEVGEGFNFELEADWKAHAGRKGGKVEFKIGLDQSNKIEKFCKENNISPFIFFLTVYKLLLFQTYGKRDVVVGVPISLRRNAQYKRIIGDFINLLPIRLNTYDKSFLADAKGVSATFVEAMLNKRVPYARLAEEIEAGKNQKYSIIQTTFNFLTKNSSDNNLVLDQNFKERQTIFGYEIETFAVDQQLDQMDLALELIQNEQGFNGLFKFNQWVLLEGTVSDYAKRYQNLISRILMDTDISVEQLRYSDEVEKKKLIYQTGQNEKQFPKYDNTLVMIENAASRFPDRIAVQDEVSCLSYKELIRKVQSFAFYLKKTGVKKGDLVIVYMDKRFEVVVAFLAIMKVGGVYVPVDVLFPKTRIAYILECASSGWIVTTQDLVDKGNFLDKGICIDKILAEAPSVGWECIDVEVKPEDSAYIIFTSGSTGKPKGVEIQHQALINFLQSMESTLGLMDKEEVNIGGVTSISFDISILEFLLPLIVGGKSILLTKRVVTDSRLFQECIRKFRVNVFQATATTWKMILQAGWSGDKSMDVLVGGELVSKDLSQELILKFQNVWNVYGPTEATIWATTKQLCAQDVVVTVGLPLHNMEAYILDEHFRIMQKNVVGKLYLAGIGLCKGYYKMEELTSERFTEVYLDDVKKRIYDTGDMAKYLENGEIQIIGRADDQVKLSGYRIELGEIESVLNQYTGINNSAVIIRNQRLVAYITCNQNDLDLSLDTLRGYCKKELTAYMIPSEFIMLDSIPMTANQKIDKRALETMRGRCLLNLKKDTIVSKGLYARMLTVWKEVLGDFEFGLDDNFFEVGGTSLLAMALQQKLKQHLEVDINVLDIFTYPTIQMLSDYIDGTEKKENFVNKEVIHKGRNRLENLRKRRNNI